MSHEPKKSRWAHLAEHNKPKDNNNLALSAEDAIAIIKTAGEKLYKYGLLKFALAGHQIDVAKSYFMDHSKHNYSPEQNANIALLAVINVFANIIPGIIREDSWGSFLVFIKNTMSNETHSNAQKIINILNTSPLNREFINKLSANITSQGLNLSRPQTTCCGCASSQSDGSTQSSGYGPVLIAAKNPYDPFKNSSEKKNEDEK